MASKKPQTFAKMERERRVRDKRTLKREKKQAAALERAGGLAEPTVEGQPVDSEESAPEEPNSP
jgi:hypothetical protein